MEQLRVIEIAIKPPFSFFVMIQGRTTIYFETNSLSKAKQVGEELLLKEGKYSFIHSVYYSNDENRKGWLSERIWCHTSSEHIKYLLDKENRK